MPINWFPGHMHATKKAILERIKEIDVVIEMLDARLPGSSCNPMLAELTAGKPNLKLLNKQDLADPMRTAAWLAHYNALPACKAIGMDASESAPAQRLIAASRELAPNRGGMVKPLRVLICGIPNVGKSTLINTFVSKRATKTGDEAGVTKTEQRISLADDCYLFDTPGMLWPRISVPQSGYNLAASGAVGRAAYDDEEVAFELLGYLKIHYANGVAARYKLDAKTLRSATATDLPDPVVGQDESLDIRQVMAALSDDELLAAIARKRGAVHSGGRINTQKASELVIHDFRTTQFGRATIETPGEHAVWTAAAELADAKRANEKAADKLARRQR